MCLQGWLGLRRGRGTDQEGNEEGKGRMLLTDSGSWDSPQRGKPNAGPAFLCCLSLNQSLHNLSVSQEVVAETGLDTRRLASVSDVNSLRKLFTAGPCFRHL